MAFGEILFVVEDGDILAYEAVCDSSTAVYVCALHDDSVFDLGVSDDYMVSDARIRADEDVWAYLAVVANYDGASNGCTAVDD